LVPAIAIFFICCGLLEEDIVLIICGHTITFAVLWMSLLSYHLMKAQFQNWF
jgi:hypothetical protein